MERHGPGFDHQFTSSQTHCCIPLVLVGSTLKDRNVTQVVTLHEKYEIRPGWDGFDGWKKHVLMGSNVRVTVVWYAEMRRKGRISVKGCI